MNNHDLSFLDAIRMAKKAERSAATFYREAAQRTSNPLGWKLFEQLADFECYHYTKLAELEHSLCKNGACATNEGRELAFPLPKEVKQIREANTMSAMKIIAQAREIKVKAKKRYATLAEQTNDPSGQDMFRRLAEEESANLSILDEAYWSLTNRGVWMWPEHASEGTDLQSCVAVPLPA